jgi:hypothetical protein
MSTTVQLPEGAPPERERIDLGTTVMTTPEVSPSVRVAARRRSPSTSGAPKAVAQGDLGLFAEEFRGVELAWWQLRADA